MKTKQIKYAFAAALALSGTEQAWCKKAAERLPNIVWITSEDNSPILGCYGDSFATTPHLDKLASEGFLYTHAYANAPVSAAVRNTIITGVYACSAGNQHMRSVNKKSDIIHYYPEFLRKSGYYCTNNSKEDYNISPEQTEGIWDDLSENAHYKNRKPGQPFFAIFNTNISHESCIHKSIPAEQLRHSPNKVVLPPYHPDTPEIRHDWAQYYDKVEEMDTWVGKIVKELEESGELENTIIFYYGDHGGVLGRSKRFVYETGTHVPLIIRIPERYKYLYPASQSDSRIDRLVSFVDLAPTLLSIIGVDIPAWMQGNAFLGRQTTSPPEYVYMFRNRMDERYDMTRSVRDRKFRYIRNYMPHRIYGQHINYLWAAPSMRSWEKVYLEGKCNAVQSAFWQTKPTEELYDTENDPWEVNNLATDLAYKTVLERMRNANDKWMRKIIDADFIPEGEYKAINQKTSLYDYMRSENVSFSTILQIANTASEGDKVNISLFKQWLRDKDQTIRYWAATGLLIIGENAQSAIPELKEALHDTSPSVAIVAAEALYKLGEKKQSLNRLIEAVADPDIFVRNHALNVLDFLDEKSHATKEAVMQLMKRSTGDKNPMRYDIRMVKWLSEKWELNYIPQTIIR